MRDPDLVELLEIYSDHIEKQGELIIQLVERIRKLETDLLHFRYSESYDETPGTADAPQQ